MDKLLYKFFSLLIFLLSTSTALAGTMQVSISGISSDAQLYLDFIDGGQPANSLTLSSFSSDGAMTLKELNGSATATANGYEISDNSFLNGVALSLKNVTSLSFLISFTNIGCNVAWPSQGDFQLRISRKHCYALCYEGNIIATGLCFDRNIACR